MFSRSLIIFHLPLLVKVTIIMAVSTDLFCDNDTMSITCSTESVLSITRANYGRFSIAVCNDEVKEDLNTDCESIQETTAFLRSRCENKTACSLKVNSKVFPPACPGTLKYLEVQYECLEKVEPKRVHQNRLPRLLRYINDVWSDKPYTLNREQVEEVISEVIRNNRSAQTTFLEAVKDKKVQQFKPLKNLNKNRIGIDLNQSSTNQYKGCDGNGSEVKSQSEFPWTSDENEKVDTEWSISELVLIGLGSFVSTILILLILSLVICKVKLYKLYSKSEIETPTDS